MASQEIPETDDGSLPAITPPLRPVVMPPTTPLARPTLLPALITGCLLWLCFFPIAWGWLAWVALVPLLTLVRSPARPRWIYFSAWAAGLVFFWPILKWMPVADDRMYYTWAGLATYCSFYFPLAIWFIRFLDHRTRLPLVVTLPIVWTALEYLRCQFGTGFSWYLLAHSQHAFLPIIQIADTTGAWGVSFLVATLNALVFESLYARAWFRESFIASNRPPRYGRLALLGQGGCVLAMLLAAVVYGHFRLGQAPITAGPRVALIQGNMPQQIRNDSASMRKAVETMEAHYTFLGDLAALYKPDLIVLPETSYPFEWVESSEGQPSLRSQVLGKNVAARFHTSVLLGMNASVGEGRQRHRYNSAVLIDSAGKPQGRFDKMHRVPFGEYVPLRDVLPWMNRFAPYDFEYGIASGEHFTRFPIAAAGTRETFTFGAIICYEDTDSDISRPYGGSDGKSPADFLVNISNDGWFLGTSEHDEHLAICRFRAVEGRRSVVRAVNMGISAVIDSNGRVLRPEQLEPINDAALLASLKDNLAGDAVVWSIPPGSEDELPVSRWAEFKKVSGVLLATVPIDHRLSLYAHWGDFLPWSCGVLLLSAIILALVRPGCRPPAFQSAPAPEN